LPVKQAYLHTVHHKRVRKDLAEDAYIKYVVYVKWCYKDRGKVYQNRIIASYIQASQCCFNFHLTATNSLHP